MGRSEVPRTKKNEERYRKQALPRREPGERETAITELGLSESGLWLVFDDATQARVWEGGAPSFHCGISHFGLPEREATDHQQH